MKISKTVVYLFFIFILAFALRLISGYYVDIGTDEMIYSLIPLNIISAGRLSTVEQAPLYFYLTDIGYKLMGGLTLVSTRLPSIFFGSLTILVIFLIAQELFENKKAAFLSAFLFAISSYAIRHNPEMDMTAFFFSLLSLFFFIRFLKGNHRQIYLSALFLALAALAKPIVLLFAPVYFLVWLVQGYRQQSGILFRKEGKIIVNRKMVKVLLFSLLISILVVSPVLIYNYLLFKEKGMTDYYFTTLAGVGENTIYQGQEGNAWRISSFFSTSQGILKGMFRIDALILILGFLGIVFSWRKEKYNVALLLLSTLFLFVYLTGKTGSSTHYVWVPLVLSIFAGYGLVRTQEYFTNRFRFRHFLIIIIILSFVNTAVVFREIIPLKKTSFAITLQEYAQENIPADAIVVLDPRIYRGVFAWAFHDWHYLEGTYFPKLTEAIQKSPEPKQNLSLYYIECGPGTFCGWKPEDFTRIYDFGEQLSTLFRQQTEKIAEINVIDTFIVYKGSLAAPPTIYETIDRTHSHWYTPVGWKYKENAVDNYTPKTALDKALNGLGFFILYLGVLIALLSPVLVVYLLGRRSG